MDFEYFYCKRLDVIFKTRTTKRQFDQCMCVPDLGDDTLGMGSDRLVGTLCTEIEKVEGTTGGVHGIRPHHILNRHHRHTH